VANTGAGAVAPIVVRPRTESTLHV